MDLWESSHHPGSQDLEAHTRSTSLPRRTKRWVVGGSPPLTRLRTSTHLTTDRNLTASRSVPDALDFSASPQTGQWTLIKSRRTRNCPLPRRTAWLMILWTQLRRQKRSQRKSWRRVPPNEPTTREITSPTGGRGLGHPLGILRDPFTYGLGPFQMAPFGLAGIWSIWRDHTFDSLDLDITCQQARVAQTGTPITEQKDAFAAEGCCLCCVFIRRTFLVTCWHFLFAWRLAGKQEYVCNVHLSKMSPFWLKWAWSEWSVWKNPPTTPRVGHGSWTTCETSEGDSRSPQRGCGQVAQISPSLTDLQADPMDCPGSDGQGRLHYDGRPCLSVDNGRFGTSTDGRWSHSQRGSETNEREPAILDPWGLWTHHVPATPCPQRPQRERKRKRQGEDQDWQRCLPGPPQIIPQWLQGRRQGQRVHQGRTPSGWPANWALQSPTGVPYCRDFHLKHSCTGNCNRSHACPVRVNGWTCNGDHSPDKCSNKGKPWTLPGPGAYSPQGPASGEKGPTNEEPVKAQTDGIHGLAPTFVPATATKQFSEPVPKPTKQGASAAVSPTPPNFSKVSPIPEAPLQMTGDLVTPPTTVQDLLTLFPWIASVPERLQQRLLWGSQVAPLTFEKPGQLLLYVGLSDEKSLDSTLAAVNFAQVYIADIFLLSSKPPSKKKYKLTWLPWETTWANPPTPTPPAQLSWKWGPHASWRASAPAGAPAASFLIQLKVGKDMMTRKRWWYKEQQDGKVWLEEVQFRH